MKPNPYKCPPQYSYKYTTLIANPYATKYSSPYGTPLPQVSNVSTVDLNAFVSGVESVLNSDENRKKIDFVVDTLCLTPGEPTRLALHVRGIRVERLPGDWETQNYNGNSDLYGVSFNVCYTLRGVPAFYYGIDAPNSYSNQQRLNIPQVTVSRKFRVEPDEGLDGKYEEIGKQAVDVFLESIIQGAEVLKNWNFNSGKSQADSSIFDEHFTAEKYITVPTYFSTEFLTPQQQDEALYKSFLNYTAAGTAYGILNTKASVKIDDVTFS